MLFFRINMKKLRKLFYYFTTFEKILWALSVTLISLSFFIFDGRNYPAFIASLVGVTALIFIAKGNPFGQMLMIIFGAIYGYISFSYRYFGEMITYMGMTVPMAILSLIKWLQNPYKGRRSEVTIFSVTFKHLAIISAITLVVTVGFYFILRALGTANLIISTFSVTTSCFAVCLTFLRSPYFSLAYATNDIVLIALWILATVENTSYISVVICFVVFLFNDLYAFTNWQKLKKGQNAT